MTQRIIQDIKTEIVEQQRYFLTFLYSAVSSPPTAQGALHFTPWQACSFQRHFDFSVNHSTTLQLLREEYSFRCPPLSVARYSIIQLSKLWQRWVNEIAKASKRQQKRIRTRVLSIARQRLPDVLTVTLLRPTVTQRLA